MRGKISAASGRSAGCWSSFDWKFPSHLIGTSQLTQRASVRLSIRVRSPTLNIPRTQSGLFKTRGRYNRTFNGRCYLAGNDPGTWQGQYFHILSAGNEVRRRSTRFSGRPGFEKIAHQLSASHWMIKSNCGVHLGDDLILFKYKMDGNFPNRLELGRLESQNGLPDLLH